MAQVNPYLNFNGNCREAMTFYKDSIGGELTLQQIGGTPMEEQCPPSMKDQIMHSMLVKDGLVLMASDMTGPEGFIPGNTMSISVNCKSEDEITSLFNNLSEGGKIFEPLKDMFWGAKFAAFMDKFGVRWMLNYDKNMASHN